jgi:hypothetical protein
VLRGQNPMSDQGARWRASVGLRTCPSRKFEDPVYGIFVDRACPVPVTAIGPTPECDPVAEWPTLIIKVSIDQMKGVNPAISFVGKEASRSEDR